MNQTCIHKLEYYTCLENCSQNAELCSYKCKRERHIDKEHAIFEKKDFNNEIKLKKDKKVHQIEKYIKQIQSICSKRIQQIKKMEKDAKNKLRSLNIIGDQRLQYLITAIDNGRGDRLKCSDIHLLKNFDFEKNKFEEEAKTILLQIKQGDKISTIPEKCQKCSVLKDIYMKKAEKFKQQCNKQKSQKDQQISKLKKLLNKQKNRSNEKSKEQNGSKQQYSIKSEKKQSKGFEIKQNQEQIPRQQVYEYKANAPKASQDIIQIEEHSHIPPKSQQNLQKCSPKERKPEKIKQIVKLEEIETLEFQTMKRPNQMDNQQQIQINKNVKIESENEKKKYLESIQKQYNLKQKEHNQKIISEQKERQNGDLQKNKPLQQQNLDKTERQRENREQFPIEKQSPDKRQKQNNFLKDIFPRQQNSPHVTEKQVGSQKKAVKQNNSPKKQKQLVSEDKNNTFSFGFSNQQVQDKRISSPSVSPQKPNEQQPQKQYTKTFKKFD